jgi:hypothetical protein
MTQESVTLKLEVTRRLDNRPDHDDQSPEGWELHDRRQRALHEAFDGQPDIKVISWGKTDDREKTHETVIIELIVTIVASAAVQHVVIPGAIWLAEKLAEKAVDTVFERAAKSVMARLWPKQEAKKISDFTITLPDKTMIKLGPPGRDGTIRIWFNDGKLEEVSYSKVAQAAG